MNRTHRRESAIGEEGTSTLAFRHIGSSIHSKIREANPDNKSISV